MRTRNFSTSGPKVDSFCTIIPLLCTIFNLSVYQTGNPGRIKNEGLAEVSNSIDVGLMKARRGIPPGRGQKWGKRALEVD
jgi:hypothetical protein